MCVCFSSAMNSSLFDFGISNDQIQLLFWFISLCIFLFFNNRTVIVNIATFPGTLKLFTKARFKFISVTLRHCLHVKMFFFCLNCYDELQKVASIVCDGKFRVNSSVSWKKQKRKTSKTKLNSKMLQFYSLKQNAKIFTTETPLKNNQQFAQLMSQVRS